MKMIYTHTNKNNNRNVIMLIIIIIIISNNNYGYNNFYKLFISGIFGLV